MIPRVLDVCCGSRMFWFNRQNPDALFIDKRSESHSLTDRSSLGGMRHLEIAPDLVLDFTNLPFENESFPLIVFDPPHLNNVGATGWLAKKYGVLGKDWKVDITKGFAECFRVLKADGTLIFKWNETQIPIKEVLALTPVPPLFGHPTGRKGLTHWVAFIKPRAY